MKKYKIKITPKLLKKLKKYWNNYLAVESSYFKIISLIEKNMSEDTGIDDIEIFFSDGGVVGIGNLSRTMPLIQRQNI